MRKKDSMIIKRVGFSAAAVRLLFTSLLLTLTVMFFSCNNGDQIVETTDMPIDTVTARSALVLADGGKINCRIVLPDNSGIDVTEAFEKVRDALNSATGDLVSVGNDWLKAGSEHDGGAVEILIGLTNYPETETALEQVNYGSNIVCVSDNKLIIAGYSEYAILRAAEAFTDALGSFTSTDEDGKVSIAVPVDFVAGEKINKITSVLPKYPGGVCDAAYDCGDNCHMLLIKDTDIDTYHEYLDSFAGTDYERYSENAIGDNRFAVFFNDSYTVNVEYTVYSSEVRLIIEKGQNLAYSDPASLATGTHESSVTQIGLEFANSLGEIVGNGMSYVFQLCDGSFIVIDGGYRGNDDASRLHSKLAEMAPDPKKIVIAAWILTHAHGDHNGAFVKFCTSYSDFTVERIIYNYPDPSVLIDSVDGANREDSISAMGKLTGVRAVKAHAGQAYNVRNAVIEVLYTHENLAPDPIVAYNNTSVVIRITIAGKTFIFLGDAQSEAQSVVAKMYSVGLKCDYIQAAHHGCSGGSTVVYGYAQPEYVFWPAGTVVFEKIKGVSYNAFLLGLKSVKAVYVAGSTNLTIKLG